MSITHEIVLLGEERADLTQGSLFFVGNATLIIRYAGFTILNNDYAVKKSPIEDFLELARSEGVGDRIHFMKHGDTYTFTVNGARQ
ncbi:MAG: hypothetical protein H0U76_20880 [Ktedonobacteraceae bacterium]|nr:hypothetical protein [Ktedonobacteraceae bacterium]